MCSPPTNKYTHSTAHTHMCTRSRSCFLLSLCMCVSVCKKVEPRQQRRWRVKSARMSEAASVRLRLLFLFCMLISFRSFLQLSVLVCVCVCVRSRGCANERGDCLLGVRSFGIGRLLHLLPPHWLRSVADGHRWRNWWGFIVQNVGMAIIWKTTINE